MRFCKENVLALKIPVQDLTIMYMLDRKTYLSEPLQDFVLRQVFLLLLEVVLQIAPVCVVHDNAELASLGLVDFAETNDVGVVEGFHDFCFVEGLLFLFFWHLGDVDLLDDGKSLG